MLDTFSSNFSVMKKPKKITLASKPTYQGYSYAFKVAIVDRVEQGHLSINQAAKEFDVSRSAIQKWVRKYGNLDKKLRELGGKSPKQEIAELKKKLAEAEKRAFIWETAVDVIEEEFKIDVKKKYLSQYDKSVLRELDKKNCK